MNAEGVASHRRERSGNYELLKYQDKNNGVQRARQRRRKAKTTALFLKGYLAQKDTNDT